MPWLPTEATVTYNGYTFTGPVETRYSAEFVYDRAETTVVGVKYRLQLDTLIRPGDNQNDADTDEQPVGALNKFRGMRQVRKALSKPGQRLVIEGAGFGDTDINGFGAVQDSRWGPKPKVLELVPVGGEIMYSLSWQVEWMVPECDFAKYRFAVMAFNYRTQYTTDSKGLGSRTYSGYLEIPQSRPLNFPRFFDNPDRYFEDVAPPIPKGWRRTNKTRSISDDKRVLEFSFTDSQIPNEYGFPPGIVEWSGRHDLSTSGMAFVKWDNTISADYTMAQGQPKSVSFDAFMALLLDRLRQAQRGAGGTVFLTGFSAGEGLGLSDQEHSYDASFFFTADLDRAIQTSGLWRPIPNADWDAWNRSIPEHQNPRGWSGLAESSDGVAIIDLCAQARNNAGGVIKLAGRRRQPGRVRFAALKSQDPRSNWLLYRGSLELENDTGKIRHKIIGDELNNAQLKAVGFRPVNPGAAFARPGGRIINQQGFTDDRVQQRSSPTWKAVLSGDCLRAGTEPIFPALLQVGGVEAEPVTQKTGKRHVATLGGMPIYRGWWRFEYILPNGPAGGAFGAPTNIATE